MLVFLLAALENDEDKKLFTEIYEQYRPQMERTAMHFLKSHADIEDAVQNAFMQMIRHFEKIYEIPCEELSFWIISIVVVPAGHTARYSCTIFAIDMRRQLQKLIQLLFSPFDDINIRKVRI